MLDRALTKSELAAFRIELSELLARIVQCRDNSHRTIEICREAEAAIVRIQALVETGERE